MFTVNPTNTDELCDYALDGIAGVYRSAQSHVLNQKAIALVSCKFDWGENMRTAALWWRTSTAESRSMRTTAERWSMENVGSGGDGPYSPTRIGSVPALGLLDYMEEHSLMRHGFVRRARAAFVSHFALDAKKVHRMVRREIGKRF